MAQLHLRPPQVTLPFHSMPGALPELTPDKLARYSRHIRLADFGLEGQRRLAAARILVIGAGGLGSPAALYLAAAGIGTLGLADYDTVEEHNLQRQVLHDTTSVGKRKVDSAAARLRALNPDLDLRIHDSGISAANAIDLFGQYDVIVDGSDNFSTRYLANDAAVLAGRPLVHASIFRFEGQVTVFAPEAGGPCYRCLFPEPPPAGSVPDCAEAGVLGAVCGVLGSLQALEAIKLVTGVGEPLIGKLLTYDALTQSFRTLKIGRDEACPSCGKAPSIREIREENYRITCAPDAAPDQGSEIPLEVEVDAAASLLERHPDQTLLVDVREPFELGICRIDGSRDIPLGQLAAQADSLPTDRHLLVLCHHGNRSFHATQYLRSRGFPRVSNVAGGIDAWARELDPSLRRY